MQDEGIKIQCPYCCSSIVFTRDTKGKTSRWVGRVAGGVGGAWMGSSLGIAGAIFGVSVALPATIPALIIGIVAGDKIGKIFSDASCPECGKEIGSTLKSRM